MSGRSIRFRLTVWYAAILTAGLGLFGGLTWLSLRHQLIQEIDEELEGRAGRFESFFETEAEEFGEVQLRDELEEFCQALPPPSYIQLSGTNGFVFSYPPDRSAPADDFRTLRRQFSYGKDMFDLEVGVPVQHVRHTLYLLRLLLLGLIPLVIALACAGGAWLSGRALKPVHDITAAAMTISVENLSERLPVPATRDEIARLTEALNTMLTRLESAVKTLSQFVADASHELRTPVAVVRTTAELALRRTRTPEAYRDALQNIAGETERMTQLVEDLLILARSDTGAVEMPLGPLDVREVVREVCAEVRELAEARRIRVRASLGEEPATVSGNRPALHRLFLALIDNAVKYSRHGGEVIAAARAGDSEVSVTIEDFGTGISEADLPHIFERFYRADPARTGSGYGLGLSLAESIARAHGARIEVKSKPGVGTTFHVVFVSPEARLAAVNPALSVVRPGA